MVKWDTYAVRWTLYRKLDMLVATISLAWQVCGHQEDRANHLTDLFLGVAVSIGLRAALEKHDIPGKIVLLGTPGWSSASRHQFIPRSHATKKAEEVGNGKVALLEKGAYDGIDVCLMYV